VMLDAFSMLYTCLLIAAFLLFLKGTARLPRLVGLTKAVDMMLVRLTGIMSFH
jgi:hypothetical protein